MAQRIEEGLNILIKNGEFQALLTKQTFYQRASSQLDARTIIYLDNPLLSVESANAISHYLPLITQSAITY